MSGLYAPSELELSLGINRAPENSTEAVGLSALNAGDIYGMQQQVMRSTAALQSGVAPPAPPQPEAQAYFSRSTGKMFAGGMAFDERDVQSAFRAAQQFTAAAGARPPQDVADWQPLSRAGYEAYLNELRTPRGIGENLVLGARGAVGGFVSGIGRGAEMVGATNVGPAIAGFGEAITGQDEFDRQRSALIQQSNSLVSNIIDAAVQGITSLGISAGAGVVGGVVGGAIGGPAGAAAGATTAATAAQAGRALASARGIGAVLGLGAASFPQQLNTFYEAAQNARDAQGRPAYDLNDTSTQLTIFGAALGTSLLDVIAPGRAAFGLSRALTEGAQQAGTQALTGLARARAVGGSAARSGFEEAATEATQTLVERAVFDPEFRRQLNAEDIKALAPYIVNTYGQDVLIAAGAGALLGAGFGGAGRFIETRGAGSQPRNILDPTQTNAIGGADTGEAGTELVPVGGPPPGGPPTPGALVTPGTPPISGSVSGGYGDLLRRTQSLASGEIGGAPSERTYSGYGEAYARRMPDPLGVAGFGGADDTFNRMVSGPAPGTEAPLTSYIYPGPVLTEPGSVAQLRPPASAIPGAPVVAPYTPTPTAPIPSGSQPITLVAPGADALRAQRGLTTTAQQRQVEQDIQSRVQANASAPRPDVLYDPSDPGAVQRAMRSFGFASEKPGTKVLEPDATEILRLRDPMRAGEPITLRDVNEAAAMLGRTRGSGTPVARPTPVVPANMAQAMQDVGLTVEDVVAARDRLRSGPVTYEDVRIAARRKGTELPVRMARAAAPESTVETALPPALEALAAAPTPTPATKLKKGKARAPEVRQVEQGGLSQRTGAGGPVPSKGKDRLKPTKEQGGGGQTGRSNLTRQGRAAAQEVTPAPAAEVAAQRPFSLAAPNVTERAAPSAAPRAEAATPNTFDRQITQAATSANPAAQLRTLKNELITRRDATADAGRSTTELTQAIDRIDALVAEGPVTTPDVEGVSGPGSPQSVWAAAMNDDGVGYTQMSEDGRRAWDNEVATSPVPPTAERAQYYQDTFLPEDTQRSISYVRSLASKLASASDERYLQITEKLSELASSDNQRVAAEAQRALDGELSGTPGRFSLSGWNTRQGTVNADGTPTTPMAVGRVRMLVNNFVAKLATKPKVTVVANQQELQRTNPALYQQAVAARPQGDFATAEAAGYSFGDGNVIIFTDRIANEQHLRFVLAHETFGHFGMRGIMPASRFNALMENIYETDGSAKLAVDAAMEVRGLSKAEAVEEYLSDYAGMLETSTVARIWNAIKGFLDRLGVKFGDTATRYFLDQSRRYVRQGAQGVTFDAQAVAKRLHAVEYGDTGTGRFSPQAAMSANAKANLFVTELGPWPTNFAETWDYIQKQGKNIANIYDDVKAKFLSLANYRALENPGLSAFDGLMGQTNQISMAVKASLNEYLRPVLDAPKAVQDKISRTMYNARSYKISQFKAGDLGKEPLFKVAADGTLTPNTAEQERIFKAGLMTLKQIQDGYSYNREIEGTDGKVTTVKETVAAQKDFTKEDYALYERARRAVFNVEMQLLQAEYGALMANKRLTNKEISGFMADNKLTAEDRRFVDSMARRALALYTEGAGTDPTGNTVIDPKAMKKSDDFLAAVNAATIGTGTDRNAAVRDYFASPQAADAFITELTAFKDRRREITDDNRFSLQNKVKQLILNEHNLNTRDKISRRSVMTGYTPVLREGNFQTRVQAFVNGKLVEVKDAHKALLSYSQFNTEPEAKTVADMLDKEFKGKTFELLVRNDAGEFVPTKVTLRTTTGRVLDAVAADPQLNLQEFLYGLNLFNVNLNPESMARIVTTLSRQGDGARRRLEYSQTPGFDPTTGIYAISRHIEGRASTIAKATTRQALRELMNLDIAESRALWSGDEVRVNQMQAEMNRLNADPNASQDAKRYALQQLTQAQYQFRMTNPEGRAERSMAYYNQAASTLDYLEGSKYVDETDFGAGPVASRVRAYTSVWQLGGSLAQGVLNLLSPYTNWMPYMASFNAKNGFGGGFGIGKVQSAYHSAFRQVGAPGILRMTMNQAEFYDNVAKDPALQKKHGLTVDEAKVIANEIRQGKLIPAQSNALIATARGQTTNKFLRGFIDKYMAPFNLSEQAGRRAAFLAAYRLKRDQMLGAGKSQKDAQQEASDFAVKSLDLTLGDYSVLNRPPAFRAGITSFLYMYKTYPTTTIQLLANLSRPAQLSMLAGLWFLSGAAGLPFAEDLEDLIDTISQKLGFRQGSIRGEIIKHIEATFPGMSAIFLKGLVNEFLPIPADIASRTSMGNIIPGTGAFLAGADVARELGDILGPAAGFISGTAEMARNLVVFPFSSRVSLEDVARESPITLLRLMGDSYAYLQSGAVVDRRGYVVSKDMDMGTIITRLAGFYPSQAANQYDVIRIANRTTDYQKEAVASFRHAWIKATLRGDTQAASEIMNDVREWNNATRGTPLEIRNFSTGNTRALREAQRPAGERALRAAPRAAQEDIRGFIDALID